MKKNLTLIADIAATCLYFLFFLFWIIASSVTGGFAWWVFLIVFFLLAAILGLFGGVMYARVKKDDKLLCRAHLTLHAVVFVASVLFALSVWPSDFAGVMQFLCSLFAMLISLCVFGLWIFGGELKDKAEKSADNSERL